ncbi:GNAT family N-acetyltransferase [Nonomuraea sp. ZG12]|uniref:GNAT family N-acetyltransferase n=1 Tax=Nonomuraea sp. ZG12 TaxID=3452207 RepID=UPI003F893F03
MIREFTSLAELRAACDDDLLVWAAQDLIGRRSRAWALGDAVVAAAPDISRHDRIAVWGGPDCAVELVRHALTELGPTYRPFGERELMTRVMAELTELKVSGEFSWMSLTVPPPPATVSSPPATAHSGPATAEAAVARSEPGTAAAGSARLAGPARLTPAGPAGGRQATHAGPDVGAAGAVDPGAGEVGAEEGSAGEVGWLDEEDEVAALLARHAPGSYAVPGVVGVRRWAGVRIGGRPAAVAADAWSAPSVGLLAGVATAARWRGQGLAERVCRWVSRELVAEHGRAALMVDDGNATAIALYERLGYRRRLVLSAVMN